MVRQLPAPNHPAPNLKECAKWLERSLPDGSPDRNNPPLAGRKAAGASQGHELCG